MKWAYNKKPIQPSKLPLKRIAVLAIILIAVPFLVFRPASAAISIRGTATTGENGTGSTSVTINKPTGTLENDVMIASIGIRGGVGFNTPSGWTLIETDTVSATLQLVTLYRVADTTDTNTTSYTFTLGGSNKASGGITTYSGVDPYNPVNVSASQNSATAVTTMTAPSVTTTTPNAMIVAAFTNAAATNHTVGSSMTQRYTVFSSGGGGAGSKATTSSQDVLQASSGATGTKTATGASAVYVAQTIALKPEPIVSQSSYRFFQNTDSATASTPYAAADTAASIPKNTPFRLRLNLGAGSTGSAMTAGSPARKFYLEFAIRGSDNVCDSSFTGESYTSVGTSSSIRFYDNPSVADGAAYQTSANDPVRSGVTSVPQNYDDGYPFNVSTDVPSGQDGLWDLSLTTVGVTEGVTYCLRTVNTLSVGSVLTGTYSVMPQFTVIGPNITQANYRWFANANSAIPGAALAAQDTTTSIGAQVPFRLRQRLAVDTMQLTSSDKNFELQYAEKSGTCDTSFSGENYISVRDSSASENKFGTTAVEDSSSGTNPWGGGVTTLNTLDNVYSGVGSGGSSVSTYIAKLTGYGFSIPSGATITGFSISTPVSVSTISTSYTPSLAVTPIVGGSVSGSGQTTFYNSSGDSTTTFGSSTSLFGLSSPTPTQINASNFGFALQAGAEWDPFSLDDSSISVDSAKVRVYYTLPSQMSFYDNATPADATSISSTGNDPTNSGRSTVYQTYRETDPFTNSVLTVPAGQDGIWDFAINTNNSASGKTFCFRVVNSDGSLLNTYTNIPEITITSTGPTLDQVTRGGGGVINGLKQNFTW